MVTVKRQGSDVVINFENGIGIEIYNCHDEPCIWISERLEEGIPEEILIVDVPENVFSTQEELDKLKTFIKNEITLIEKMKEQTELLNELSKQCGET